MRPADSWRDYELLDATNHNRLERWGQTLLIRPDPQVIWKNDETSPLWAKADAVYYRSAKGGGQWNYHKKLPQKWQIHWNDLTLIVSPTGFKHTGVFPEQAVNWAWYQEKIRQAGRPIRVLNLFSYTGRRNAGVPGRGCVRHPCGRQQGHGRLGAGERCRQRAGRPPLPLDRGRLRQVCAA